MGIHGEDYYDEYEENLGVDVGIHGEDYYDGYDENLGDDDFEAMAELEREMADAGVGDLPSPPPSRSISRSYSDGSDGGASGGGVPSGAMPTQGKCFHSDHLQKLIHTPTEVSIIKTYSCCFFRWKAVCACC